MEDNVTQATEPQAEVAVVETPQETAAPVETTAPTQEAAATTAEGEAPVYEPNYKFNIKDQEHEFEDWAKGLVKDKDTEDKFRDIFTKTHAFDGMKDSREKLQGEYDSVNGSYKKINGDIEILRDHVQNKDFDSFFNAVGIDKKLVQQWMYQDLQRQNMPPEQQAQHDQHWSNVRENSELRRENAQLTQAQSDMATQAHESEFNRVLQDPNVNQIMRDFDARQGRVGAFRDEVSFYALGKFNATGQDMNANEAVNAFLNFTGMGLQNQAGQQPQTMATQAQSQVVAPQHKPTIPNIQGRNTSPVRKAPRSIEDMKAQYQERYGND